MQTWQNRSANNLEAAIWAMSKLSNRREGPFSSSHWSHCQSDVCAKEHCAHNASEEDLRKQAASHSATLNFRTSQRSTFNHESNPNQNIVTSVISNLDQAKILRMLYLYILLSLCSGVWEKVLKSGKQAFDVYINVLYLYGAVLLP